MQASPLHSSHQQSEADKYRASEKCSSFNPCEQKYLEHVDIIFKEQKVSALRAPTSFNLSRGFIASSLLEAAAIVQRLVTFEQPLVEIAAFTSEVCDRILDCQGVLSANIPDRFLVGRPLAQYYGSFSIRPLGQSLFLVGFGDGVMPHSVHQVIGAPSLISAELRRFLLEPIPKTRGAIAFSTLAAAERIAQQLGEYAHVIDSEEDVALRVTHSGGAFIATLSLFSCHRSLQRANSSLVVIPCWGMETPLQLRDRLVLEISPEVSPPFDTIDTAIHHNRKLLDVTTLVTSKMNALFGITSSTRVKSLT